MHVLCTYAPNYSPSMLTREARRFGCWPPGRLGGVWIVRGKRGLSPDPRPPARLAQALNQERQEKLALQKQLGQSPPKKGQGKRASKKK